MKHPPAVMRGGNVVLEWSKNPSTIIMSYKQIDNYLPKN